MVSAKRITREKSLRTRLATAGRRCRVKVMKRPVATKRVRNAAAAPSLPPARIPVSETNLTKEEQARLKDPRWVTEDEADAIMGERECRKAGGKTYSLEEVLRENGISLVRTSATRRPKAVASPRRKRSA